MANKIGVNIYINGVKHNSTPQPDTQSAYNISDVVSAGESFNLQFSNVYDDGGESALSPVQTYTLLGTTTSYVAPDYVDSGYVQ